MLPLLAAAAAAKVAARLARGLGSESRSEATATPDSVLTDAARLVSESQKALEGAVLYARSRGASWATIGNALNMTKQSAHERFRDVDKTLHS